MMNINPITKRRLRRIRNKVKKSPRTLFRFLPWVLIVLVLFVIAFWAFQPYSSPEWTGFVEYPQQQQQTPKIKTLWDWMDLLLVPITLSFVAIFINQVLQGQARRKEEDQQREIALQEYFKEISHLLLEYNLYSASKSDDARFIAMALTQNVLARLDGQRKGLVLNFLFAVNLIRCKKNTDWSLQMTDEKPRPLVAISKADLSDLFLPRGLWRGASLTNVYIVDSDFTNADLSNADLSDSVLSHSWFCGVNFKKANLSGCDLRFSILLDCNFEGVDLTNANLMDTLITPEDLRKAKSLEGCIMFNGASYDPTKSIDEQSMDRVFYSKEIR